VVVTVAGNITSKGTLQKRRTWRFLRGLAGRAGGTLTVDEHQGMQQFEFTMPAP
jgi:hypothetical protein